ncbi:MAG: response regulator [Acidobacteriales bacterium]|nr:response regulator [Terriglobales bacterium]
MSATLHSEQFPVPRILIVDDEASIVSLLRLVLEGENYDVETAASAAEAIQKLAEFSFHLVITDIRMERPTAGFDVVRAARAISATLPVALLTAYPVPTSDWKQAGADTLFMKGMDSTLKMLEWIQSSIAAAGAADDTQSAHKKRAS